MPVFHSSVSIRLCILHVNKHIFIDAYQRYTLITFDYLKLYKLYIKPALGSKKRIRKDSRSLFY